MSTSAVWPAPAKINLFLHIVGRRDDGYHLLQTHFQFVDYGDSLHFTPTDDASIERVNRIAGIPPEQDLVVRAARLLQRHTGSPRGVRVRVDKLLPQGGGLGGGSSNAATTLVALNEIWSAGLSAGELAELGLQLGADVPVFVYGYAAFAEGVGEQLTPLEASEGPVLVVHPNCEVSTAQVFTDPQLTRDTPAIRIHDVSTATLVNDCEPVTRRLFPEVDRALNWLSQFGNAKMSGTGACVFLTFDEMQAAERVASEVPSEWNWFVGYRRNRSPLLGKLDSG